MFSSLKQLKLKNEKGEFCLFSKVHNYNYN